MLDTLPRPDVSAERYRELELLENQMALLMPSHRLEECLIIRDLIENRLRRWFRDERMVRHEVAAIAGTPILAEGGNVIHLPRVDRP
jgi:GAF domain-containing protein